MLWLIFVLLTCAFVSAAVVLALTGHIEIETESFREEVRDNYTGVLFAAILLTGSLSFMCCNSSFAQEIRTPLHPWPKDEQNEFFALAPCEHSYGCSFVAEYTEYANPELQAPWATMYARFGDHGGTIFVDCGFGGPNDVEWHVSPFAVVNVHAISYLAGRKDGSFVHLELYGAMWAIIERPLPNWSVPTRYEVIPVWRFE